MTLESEALLRLPMQQIPVFWDGSKFVPLTITDGKIDVNMTNEAIDARVVSIRGTATEVNEVGLTDDTKDFDADLLNDKIIVVKHDGVNYYRKITDTADSDLSFAALIPEEAEVPAVPAKATLGAAPGGIIDIECVEGGIAGNDYSVQVVAGSGESSSLDASFADDLLTITSATDSNGDPVAVMAGSIGALLTGIPAIAALFEASEQFTAGEIAVMAESVAFSGGIDTVPAVPAVVADVGDEYEIII